MKREDWSLNTGAERRRRLLEGMEDKNRRAALDYIAKRKNKAQVVFSFLIGLYYISS